MPVKSATVKTVDQVLDMDMSVEGMNTRPSRIRQWFTNNIIRRMFSYPLIWDGEHFRLQKATTDGVTLVASVGGGLFVRGIWNGTTTNAAQDRTFAGFTGTGLMIHVWTNDVLLEVSWSTSFFGYEMHLVADMVYMLDLSVKSVRIKSQTSDQHAPFEVVAFSDKKSYEGMPTP